MNTPIGLLILATASSLGWSGELESQSSAAQMALQAVSLKAISQQTAPTAAKGAPVAVPAAVDRRLTEKQAEEVVTNGAVPSEYQLAGTWDRLPLQGEYPKVLKLTFKFIRKSMLLSAQKAGGLGGPVVAEKVDLAADGVHIIWSGGQDLCRISGNGILACRMTAPNGWTGYATFVSRVPLSGMTSEQAPDAFKHGQPPKAEELAGRWGYMRFANEEIDEPETLVFAKAEKGLTARKFTGGHFVIWPPVDIWPSAEVTIDENWASFAGPEKSVITCRTVSSERLICRVSSTQAGAYYQVFNKLSDVQR